MTIAEVLPQLQAKGLRTMQLATVSHNSPWIATVFFVADDDGALYWLSWPERRHSRDLQQNAHIAVAIVLRADMPVAGLQCTGTALQVTDLATVTRVMDRYVRKYDTGRDFVSRFANGTNRHELYKFTPTTLQLFDELRCPGESPLQIDM